jgi:beta-glucosidase
MSNQKRFAKALLLAACLAALLLSAGAQRSDTPLYTQRDARVEQRVEDLLARMTLEEKIEQLSGTGFDTRPNQRLGIPALRMADGPAGVRWGNATAFPAPVALAASWDEELVNRVGAAMARELRSKGRNVLLGPCVNIHRHPLGGRNFESYGEDPFLARRVTVAFIKGVQSEGALACVKHYTLNNQEWERHRLDVRVGERALREIYLQSFEGAVKEAGVKTVMAAYNLFRGEHCTENAHLLNTILKKEWGFTGVVMSDWGATYSASKAANSGMDLEMPTGKFFGEKLLKAAKDGEVSESVIDDKIRRLLRVRFESGIFDRTEKEDPTVIQRKDHWELAREAAEKGVVLLKNDGGLLPLDRKTVRTLAVIGPNAAAARTGGGGSALVKPLYGVSALEGIRELVGKDVRILFAPGAVEEGDLLALPPEYLAPPNPAQGAHGLWAEYFPNADLKGEPALTRLDETIGFNWGNDAPNPALRRPDERNEFSVRWTGKLLPPKTGTYEFRFLNNGGVRLFLNGQMLVDHRGTRRSEAHSAAAELEGGKSYDLRVEYAFSGGSAQVILGWEISGSDTIQEAAELAKRADVALVFTGLSNRFESEGFDRPRMNLPRQDQLIQAVVKSNPKTVVVNQTGAPITMEGWVEQVPAILQAWYPGQEGGRAMARVIFGEANPAGKLPMSFLRRPDHSPAFKGYKDPNLVGDYSEGIYVGYRYLDKQGIEQLFPFGHGLSYTKFEYSDLKIAREPDGSVQVRVKVKNSGSRTGAEVVQVYVHAGQSSVDRPQKELKGFAKLELKAGESKSASIALKKDAFQYFDEQKEQWVLEPGRYEILVGSSSRDIRLKGSVDVK